MDGQNQERLAVAEAAQRLNVTAEAIRQRIRRGTIEHEQTKDGRCYVYTICHGPWMLVEADVVVRGRTPTSYPTPQTDIRNAGGERMDEEMATDPGLVTGRRPDALPVFRANIVEEFAKGEHADGVVSGRLPPARNLPGRSRR